LPAAGRDRVFAASLASAIALAWIALLAWERSPYGKFLDHDGLGVSQSAYVMTFPVIGWVTMSVAMMLPTTWPLLGLFDRMTARHANHRALLGRVIGGYLAIWTVFGIVVHIGDLEVHRIVDASGWLQTHAWLIGATTLVGAGIYQFSSLKYRCLAQCRSPFAFIASHWQGRDPKREAFKLGLRHGLFCLGCCWALMVVMFAIGVGSIGWMLAIGAIMAIEKNARWGRRISAPLGVTLITLGLVTGATGGGLA
jgi:predicted metal-binding membrane protein